MGSAHIIDRKDNKKIKVKPKERKKENLRCGDTYAIHVRRGVVIVPIENEKDKVGGHR